MPSELLEVAAVVSLGRPFGFIIIGLIAIGLSGDESSFCGSSCPTLGGGSFCGSSLAAGNDSSHDAKPAAKHCCCGAKSGATCHCGPGCCCHKSVPEKSVPLPLNRGNDDTSRSTKVLSHYLAAFASIDAAGPGSSGKLSPDALSALTAPLALPLQNIRLQI